MKTFNTRAMSALSAALIAGSLVCAALPAFAQAANPADAITAGTLTITKPWARATPGGAKVGGGFMTITNTGREPDRLVGGSAEISRNFEVHEMKMEGNVMRMRALDKGLEIKPGETVELKPGGFHVMFIDLHQPLKQGATIKGQLVFEKAGKVDVEYRIEALGAAGSAGRSPGPHQGHGSPGQGSSGQGSSGHGNKAP